MSDPREFAEPGLGVDYRINNDNTSSDRRQRIETPNFLEDGTIKARSANVTGSNPIAVGDGGTAIPLYESTQNLTQM